MPKKIKAISDLEVESEKTKNIEKFYSKPQREKVAAIKRVNTKINIAKKTEDMVKDDSRVKETISRRMFLVSFLSLIVVGAICLAGYFFYQYKKATSKDATKNEVQSYVSKISKFMALPDGEVPTMATVADKEKLSSQSFFAKAENGDKVLFFSKSQKAILYRPSTNMIIEATAMAGEIPTGAAQSPPVISQEAQIAAPPQQAVEQPQPQQAVDATSSQIEAQVPQQASVVVNNGTSQKGLAKTMAEKIAGIAGVTIASTGNAKGIFEKTLVVDLSGKNGALAAQIASSLGGEVGILPAEEGKPDADILVIGGEK